MSTHQPPHLDLTSDVPREAVELYRNKPDLQEDYPTISAKDAGYDNRDGDLMALIEEAARNGEIVDLESGEYEVESGVYRGSGILGVVGDGRDEATIHYTGTDENYLFRPYCDEFILGGVTFDISEPAGNGLDTDVGLVHSEIDDECWVDDIAFVGQRHYNQDVDGDGQLEQVGGRMTFLIEMAESDGTALINNARFPDGGTDEHTHVGTVGHAIGPNADPSHVGLNVWRNVYAAGFQDNGFYVAHSPGPNVLWDCHARNNGAGNMRLGDQDTVVGGSSVVTDLPPGRQGKPLESDVGSDITVTGLDIYAEGDVIRGQSQAIQLRTNFEEMHLDRCRVHLKDSHHLARFDEGDVTITDCWFYQEGCRRPAIRIGARGSPADVTATGLRIRAEDNTEISGPITIDGRDYAGLTTAADAGLDDPRPLPTFGFGGESSIPEPPIPEATEDWGAYYIPARELHGGLREVRDATNRGDTRP